MSIADIVRIDASQRREVRTRYGARYWAYGEVLTMRDGTQWLHPYSGGAPIKLEPWW